jgi:hypothetical protein
MKLLSCWTRLPSAHEAVEVAGLSEHRESELAGAAPSQAELHQSSGLYARLSLTAETSMPEIQHTTAPINPVTPAHGSTIKVYSHWQEHKQNTTAECASPVHSLVAELVKPAGGLLSRPIPKRQVKQLPSDFVP